jgi:hypothetical protein
MRCTVAPGAASRNARQLNSVQIVRPGQIDVLRMRRDRESHATHTRHQRRDVGGRRDEVRVQVVHAVRPHLAGQPASAKKFVQPGAAPFRGVAESRCVSPRRAQRERQVACGEPPGIGGERRRHATNRRAHPFNSGVRNVIGRVCQRIDGQRHTQPFETENLFEDEGLRNLREHLD